MDARANPCTRIPGVSAAAKGGTTASQGTRRRIDGVPCKILLRLAATLLLIQDTVQCDRKLMSQDDE